jgi:hypothetical protein
MTIHSDLWFFVEHGQNRTWTRAQVPAGVTTIRDLMGYLQRGGRIQSPWMDLPDRARFTPRTVGTGVLATLMESHSQKGKDS